MMEVDEGSVEPNRYMISQCGYYLKNATEDRLGREGARVAIGQTSNGRYLRVIYVTDPEPDSIFVMTAYDLKGKPLAAYRRRRKRKRVDDEAE